MEVQSSAVNDPPLPLACLRLLVPPIRLVSAAIWQTIQQKAVADYGMLEEFVTMVTELAPELLTRKQRAQLTLGLRAQLILELCRSEATADLQVIQPQLDRMNTLKALWDSETEETDVGIMDLHFLSLVEGLLRNPSERENFFKEVFPDTFGPMYDRAIETLMWYFLIRLEKRLPNQTIQKVASLLSDVPSILEECLDSVSKPEELKTLLGYKESNDLDKADVLVEGTCIMSALCLPPVERVVIDSEQVETDALGSYTYTVCTEMEVESSAVVTENQEMDMEGTRTIEECVEEQEWFYINDEVKTGGETEVTVTEHLDYESTEGESNVDVVTVHVKADVVKTENNDGEVGQNNAEKSVEVETVVLIGEDGTAKTLVGVVNNEEDKGTKTKNRLKTRHSLSLDGETSQKLQKGCAVILERLDVPTSSQSRPVRANRGLKMKTFLSQRRTKVHHQAGISETSSHNQSLSDDLDLEQRTCKICSKIVSHTRLLQQHMNQHSTELPFSCTKCKQGYKSSRYLQEHSCPSQSLENQPKPKDEKNVNEQETGKVVEEEKSSGWAASVTSDEELSSDNAAEDPSFIATPEKTPSKKPRLTKPETNNENATDGPFQCPHCSIELKNKQSFRFHLRNICFDSQLVDPKNLEDNTQCFKCDECGKAFRYKSTLESHKHTHNPLYCEVCMKLVRDPQALAMHKISHAPFQCNKCEENFPVFKTLYKHYMDIHKPTPPFTCTHCQATYGNLKRFIRHGWKHTGHEPFQCPHCPKRIRSYSDLLDHLKKHTKERPYLCWECGKAFRHNLSLTRHVARAHKSPSDAMKEEVPASLICQECGKTFTKKRALQHHDSTQHKGLRYPCTQCGKGFFCSSALVRHVLIHTGERPFKCEHCQKTFRSASELKVHRRYHTGERPFTCSICNKGFVQSCFLTLHMRTHTGERPYGCTLCSKRFQALHGLKRHKKLVHS